MVFVLRHGLSSAGADPGESVIGAAENKKPRRG
jgi:hypothetical protein